MVFGLRLEDREIWQIKMGGDDETWRQQMQAVLGRAASLETAMMPCKGSLKVKQWRRQK